ncbi:MAG: hypothetical protein AB2729_08845 [Candidatus Thiodiazotropha taylori]
MKKTMIPLLRTQKNQIFEALKKSGLAEETIGSFSFLSSEEFDGFSEYAYKDANNGYLLTYQDGDVEYFFAINGSGNSWSYRCFPLGAQNGIHSDYSEPWTTVVTKLREWGSKILSEIHADDYWERFVHVKAQFQFDDQDEIDNSPITLREGRIVRERLSLLEKEIGSVYAKTKAQKDTIRKKFEYLDGCIERQGKTDWIHTLIGVLASVAVAVGVSAANSDNFWKLIRKILGSSINVLIGN